MFSLPKIRCDPALNSAGVSGAPGCVEVLGGNQSRTQAIILAGLELLLVARPAEGQAGGDLYCVHSCDNRAFARILLLDITGHGEVAAFFARAIHRLLHQYSTDTDPARLLHSVNQQFAHFAPPGILATPLAAVYDSRRRELRYAYGGQPGILFWQAQQKRWRSLAPPRDSVCGLPFGVAETACYEEASISIAPGDILLMFSDGLPETRSVSGALLELEGVIQLAEACIQELAAHFFPLAALAEAFLKRLKEFHGSSCFQDDITLLWLRRLSEGAGGTEQALGS